MRGDFGGVSPNLYLVINMSDDNYNQRVSKRMQVELRDLDNSRARYQAQLDKYWRDKLEAEMEAERIRRELNPTGLRVWD